MALAARKNQFFSDARSEISESDTFRSDCTFDSKDLYQDWLKVDIKKLENLLIGENEPVERFFQKLMDDTNTIISWPSSFSIESYYKNDIYIVITGRIEDVEIAKRRITQLLNTQLQHYKSTMKIDVSYTDHSHIIGKKGMRINRVMEETHCHVHFPDSNRSNPTEKSNQVSIAGDLQNIELARSRVRSLTPLIFCFNVPSSSHTMIDSNTLYVIKVQQEYNVQVTFRTRPTTFVMVKGVEWEPQQVKKATMLLVEYMCNSSSSQVPIQMSMEISPSHHAIVLGRNYSNLEMIIKNTNTEIVFQDTQDINVPSLKKSKVTITGNIHNVYLARQQLMGSLPVVLLFDLPEISLPVTLEKIAEIQSLLDVTISIRHKTKQNTLTYVIKGIERNASNIYKARNQILNIKEPSIVADIPSTYFLSKSKHTEVDSTVSPTWQCLSSFEGTVRQLPNKYDSPKHFSTSSLSLTSTPEVSSSTYYKSSALQKIDHLNFEEKHRLDLKPMDDVQVSNDTWSGYGINQNNYIWNNSTQPAYHLSAPINVINKITDSVWNDLSSLLSSTGLEKYDKLLYSHEIDLTTFLFLNEQDLIEVGVTAFGARRKMMLIISELNKCPNVFSPAPGAERKNSSSTLSNRGSPMSNW
ncbi:hypothetical protein RN001_007026 [Aquatica leii]|uniref:SAM domain-containing protein n=1 Tax=Aquatica leii TaxID=1421715 RepID=A0AAN7PE92_9COLE|nr:hypothetical protein RN001_007026 [Aquatica leii]